jgi:16S rRNA (adenine1518-N6/adenine1519-N6)-dimethyltransferase
MNLTAPSEVRALLEKLDFRPSRVLGQNFLIDVNILKILLSTAKLHPGDAVLEIGPGLGVLTEWLVRWSGRVVAIEKDARLLAYLRERFAGTPNLHLIGADALDVNLEELLADGINKVVANLPYSIGSRLLVEWVEANHRPERIVVTVQREVAERLAAKVSTKDYGLMTVLTQARYAVRIRKEVRPTCFYPPPEVTSAIVDLERLDPAPATPCDPAGFKELVKTAFSQRRKQLTSLLHREPYKNRAETIEIALERIGVDRKARPENVTPAQWVEIANALTEERDPSAASG